MEVGREKNLKEIVRNTLKEWKIGNEIKNMGNLGGRKKWN